MSAEPSESFLIEQLRFCQSEIQRTRQSIWWSAQVFLLGGLLAIALLSLSPSPINWKILLASLPTLLFFYGAHDLLKTAYLASLERYLKHLEAAFHGEGNKGVPRLSQAVFQEIRHWLHPLAAATRSLFLVFFLLFLLANGALLRLYVEISPWFVVTVLSLSGLELILLGVVFFLLLRTIKGETSRLPR